MPGTIEEPETWEDLVMRLASLMEHARWIFRGQADFGWKLVTRLDRELAMWPDGADERAKLDAEVEAMNTFVSKARHMLPTIPEDDVVGWLAVMQHYGAPTRLLDWTRSPFVACYFAYATGGEGDAALWLLNEGISRIAHRNPDFTSEVGFKSFQNEGGGISISATTQGWQRQEEARERALLNREEWPLIVSPAISDERIRAQQGLFTFHGSLSSLTAPCPTETLWPEPQTLQDYLASLPLRQKLVWIGTQDVGTVAVVRKIRLKAEWRRSAIRALQGMNITPDVLFPGLDGVGKTSSLQVRFGDAIGRELSNRDFQAFLESLPPIQR